MPGPVGVTYEAGPTGFGLARFMAAEGIGCLVAAPSKPSSAASWKPTPAGSGQTDAVDRATGTGCGAGTA